jgi:hypothetical protein
MAARKPFLLRIDPELCAELEVWAKDELRSVNGQIEYVLKQAVQKRKSSRRAPDLRPAKPEQPPDPSPKEKGPA